MTTDSLTVEQAAPVSNETDRGRIIVVEDDSDFRDSVVETLTLYGYEATGAKSALDFYHKVAQKPYALVILDLGLPDQNGVVLAEFIRQNTDMRIIILTARSSIESRVSAYKAGADTYLLKPVNTDELIASIESNLGRFSQKGDDEQARGINPLEPLSSGWQLLRAASTIITPTGEKLGLSSKEIDFLEHLASKRGNASRQELAAALGYNDVATGNKALDVLVHRLRQKAAEHGVKLPIRTVRGKGYCLSEPLTVK
ncbi:response regulator transcription factor [Chlorobaculum sp. 24CR]|uniref:response regulator transcription factor n=1 Tax=Chlorobaculum sp. 24CR TaxID=2508878 RepID=UPI00100A4776|nr:response regulator transcription factor [Chlorobaculum sp. 24CR]RXK84323.1 response regulator transcription factor [Chlorobaculum sp. 24CR]